MKGQDAVSLVMNCDARSREESLVSAYCRSAEAIGASTQLQKSRHSNYELQAYTYFENETRSLVLYASVRRDSSKLNFVSKQMTKSEEDFAPRLVEVADD